MAGAGLANIAKNAYKAISTVNKLSKILKPVNTLLTTTKVGKGAVMTAEAGLEGIGFYATETILHFDPNMEFLEHVGGAAQAGAVFLPIKFIPVVKNAAVKSLSKKTELSLANEAGAVAKSSYDLSVKSAVDRGALILEVGVLSETGAIMESTLHGEGTFLENLLAGAKEGLAPTNLAHASAMIGGLKSFGKVTSYGGKKLGIGASSKQPVKKLIEAKEMEFRDATAEFNSYKTKASEAKVEKIYAEKTFLEELKKNGVETVDQYYEGNLELKIDIKKKLKDLEIKSEIAKTNELNIRIVESGKEITKQDLVNVELYSEKISKVSETDSKVMADAVQNIKNGKSLTKKQNKLLESYELSQKEILLGEKVSQQTIAESKIIEQFKEMNEITTDYVENVRKARESLDIKIKDKSETNKELEIAESEYNQHLELLKNKMNEFYDFRIKNIEQMKESSSGNEKLLLERQKLEAEQSKLASELQFERQKKEMLELSEELDIVDMGKVEQILNKESEILQLEKTKLESQENNKVMIEVIDKQVKINELQKQALELEKQKFSEKDRPEKW